MSNLVNTTDADFKVDVLESETPVLVDFWAAWCGPCKAIAPVLEDLSREYDGKVKIVKVDVTNCEETAVNYNIRNIPALLYSKMVKLWLNKSVLYHALNLFHLLMKTFKTS